jgi:aquaporin Z
MNDTFTLSPGTKRTVFDVMCVEGFFATALCLVVLNVATTKQDANNSYFGLAIGFTVVASAFGIGPVSGCAINPAVSFGTMVVHFFNTGKGLAYLLIYFATPLIGAFFATLLFRFIRRAELQADSNVYNEESSK